MILTPQELQRRHIRRAQYVSCDDAFIDVRLPGSTPKENYSIVGPGVTLIYEVPPLAAGEYYFSDINFPSMHGRFIVR